MPSEGQNYNLRLQQAASDLSTGRLELSQAENRRNSLQQQIGQALQQQLRGDGEVVALPIDQRIQTEDIKRIQHGAYFIGVGADMAGDEFIAVFEGGEGQACVHLRASGGRGRRGKWEG